MDFDLESKLISLITQLLFETQVGCDGHWYSKAASVTTQIISLVSTMDLHSQPKMTESELIPLITQTVSVFNSMDLDSQPKPLTEFISLYSRKISLRNSIDPDTSSKLDLDLVALCGEMVTIEPEPELMSSIYKIFSFVISLNSKSGKFISLCPEVQVRLGKGQIKFHVCEEAFRDRYGKWRCIGGEWLKVNISGEEDATTYFCCKGCKGKNHEEYKKAPVEVKHYLHRKHSLQLVFLVEDSETRKCYCCDEYLDDVFYYCMSCDFAMNMACVKKPPSHWNVVKSMDSESELISLISQLLFIPWIIGTSIWDSVMDSKAISLINQIHILVSSMDLDSQPKPESKVMSLITQTISLVSSMDLSSQSESLLKLTLLLQNSMDSDSITELKSLLPKTLSLEPEPELISLINQVISCIISMKSNSKKFISLWPQVNLSFENGKFYACETSMCSNNVKWDCLPGNWVKYNFPGEDATYFRCLGCNGKHHEEYNKAPVELKHHLHRKHSLQLASLRENVGRTRQCYCCDRYLDWTFYCCLSCDFAMNMACVKKQPVLHIDRARWHEHTLALFPRHASLTCNLCALADTSSPIYMCPPCDFVVHLRCINLPRVIRISRHQHRISFTTSFDDQEDLFCGVCRKSIINDYGGYFCIKSGCLYAVHSRCATQGNVWDCKELEGEPEEDIEEVEPFVKISDGIIKHISHEEHHLRLDDNSNRDYDENKECRACTTPISFGKFYSSMQCDFILHQDCANLSRKIYHPIHPHLLTQQYFNALEDPFLCEACFRYCVAGFFYECVKKECSFRLHVQCAKITEPLVHGSHRHPLFLTSKPKERRICSICKAAEHETFNCIVECDFALCFKCATLPEKVRYKHDNHTLTLSYGDETSTTVTYWCEVCEGKVDPKGRFYVCDEYCCVTLHIDCLLGRDLYMKPGSSLFHFGEFEEKVHVLPNNLDMDRYICSFCENRCPHKIAFQWPGSVFCSLDCTRDSKELDGHSGCKN